MSINKLNLKYSFDDKFLNIVLEDYRDKINYMIDNVYNQEDADTNYALYVPLTRTISTTAPLSGGGALSGNLTLSLGSMSWAGTANYLIGVQDVASDGWEYKSLLGTTNQITVTHAAVDAGDNSYGTVTLATPQDIATTSNVQFGECTLDNDGLHLLDTNASHDLIITPGSNLTADRVLTLTTGDAARTVTLSGNLTVEAASLINQDLTSDSTTAQLAALTITGAVGTTILSGTTATLDFTGGAGEKGIRYKDTGATQRLCLRLPSGSDIVELLNRAANGTVEIHANTATAGAGGDVKVVEIQDTDVILSNGIGLNLQEDITFTGATTENLIKMPDNLANALSIMEGANVYMTFVTTDTAESIFFGKAFDAPTSCTIGNLTLANGSITDSGGAISFGNENLSTTGTLGCGNVTGGTYNALTLTAAATGFTIAGGTTPKTLTCDDNFVVSTQLTAIGANTAKVTESTTVTSPLVLTTYDISIPAATNAAAGHATAAHITAIEANTAHAVDNTQAHSDYLLNSGADSMAGALTCGGATPALVLANGSITDSSGAISFGDENLSTTGTLGSGAYTLTQNSDTIALSHNGTDAYFKTSDGSFIFQTDEGVDTDTILSVIGKGTGIGQIWVRDVNHAMTYNVANDALQLHGWTAVLMGYKWPAGTFVEVARFENTGNFRCSGNFSIGGQISFGTNATKTFAVPTGVAPTTSPADSFQMYSADVGGAAGKAAVHFRDEAGNVTSIGDGQILDSSGAISFGNENLSTTGTLGCGNLTAGTIIGTTATTAVTTQCIKVAGTNLFYTLSSSKRFKDKVKDLEVDSSLIYDLRPVSFNSLCVDDDKKRRFHGLIAEEVERVCPEMINYNEKKEVDNYDSTMLTTLLLAEIQKQNKKIKAMEAYIEEYKPKIDAFLELFGI